MGDDTRGGAGSAEPLLAGRDGASLCGCLARHLTPAVDWGAPPCRLDQMTSTTPRRLASAVVNALAHGQRSGRCRVGVRPERVRRPGRLKYRRRKVLWVTRVSPRPMRPTKRARLWAMTLMASQAALAPKRPE